MQEAEIWPYEQTVYAQPSTCPGKWDALTCLWFWDKNGSLNIGQTTRPNNNQQTKRSCWNVDFIVPADHWIKLKESEKKYKYQDLAWEFKKTVKHERDDYTNCNGCSWYSHQRINKVTVGLGNEKTSGDNPNNSIIQIGQNTEKSSWRLVETCWLSNSIERPSASAGVKNSQKGKIIIIIIATTASSTKITSIIIMIIIIRRIPLSRPEKMIDSKKKRKKRRTCRIVDFAIQADFRLKIKENETRDKYLHLAR